MYGHSAYVQVQLQTKVGFSSRHSSSKLTRCHAALCCFRGLQTPTPVLRHHQQPRHLDSLLCCLSQPRPSQQLIGVWHECCASLALLLQPLLAWHGPSCCCWRPPPCPPLLLLLLLPPLQLLALLPCPWQLFAGTLLVLLPPACLAPLAAVSPACRLRPAAAPQALSPAQGRQQLLRQLPCCRWLPCCWHACYGLGRKQQQQLVRKHVRMSGAHGWLLTLLPPRRLAAPADGQNPAWQHLLWPGP